MGWTSYISPMKMSKFKLSLLILAVVGIGAWLAPKLIKSNPPYLLSEQYPDARFEKTMQKIGMRTEAKIESKLNIKTDANTESVLKEQLKPISIKKGPNGKRVWILSKSANLPTYVLLATQALEQKKCKITQSLEIEPYNKKSLFSYMCPNENEKHLVFEISNQYLENSSKLVVMFETKGAISPKILARLDELNKQYALIANPFDLDSTFSGDYQRLGSPDLFVSLPMEDYEDMRLPPNSKRNLIYFYNKASDVEDRIKNALKILPTSQGVIPMGGRRALGNQEIRKAILQYVSSADLTFLNNLNVQSFPISQECEQNQSLCIEVRNCTDTSRVTLKKCIDDNFIKTSKTSRNVMSLPLNESAIKLLDEASATFKDKGIQLTNINELSISTP